MFEDFFPTFVFPSLKHWRWLSSVSSFYVVDPPKNKEPEKTKAASKPATTTVTRTSQQTAVTVTSSPTTSSGTVSKDEGVIPKATAPSTLNIPTTTNITYKSPTDDPRTSWIRTLRKEELQAELSRFGLDASGTVDDLRRRLSIFWKEQYWQDKFASVGEQESEIAGNTLFDRTANIHTGIAQASAENPESQNVEIDRIKELLGLPPNVNFENVCRQITSLSLQATRGAGAIDSLPAPKHPLEFPTRDKGGVVYSSLPRMSTVPSIENRPQNYCSNQTVPVENTTSSICNTVRKWNVRFDGRRDPISFLERLDELMEAYSVDSSEVLKALPELLTGTALLWYRNGKDAWRTFDDFRHSFQIQFLPQGFQRNLDEEIRRRTQGENEQFRDFVVAITTLMRRKGGLTLQQKLDIIFTNMRPDYKLTMRRDVIFTVEDMIRHAEHYESYVREKALYRPPPPPSMALIPETAYHNRKKTDNTFGSSAVEILPENGKIVSSGNNIKSKEGACEYKSHWDRRGVLSRTSPVRLVTPRGPRNEQGPRYTPKELPNNGIQDRPPPKCWNCDKVGHLYRHCHLPRRLKCFNCRKEGVRTFECDCKKSENINRVGPMREVQTVATPQNIVCTISNPVRNEAGDLRQYLNQVRSQETPRRPKRKRKWFRVRRWREDGTCYREKFLKIEYGGPRLG